jgi:hypothetical protein
MHGYAGAGEEREFSREDHENLDFQHQRIYKHAFLRINYTTYDLRRDQDIVNPRTTKCDVMVYSNEEHQAKLSHPFWYARVLGIFHAQVITNPTRTPQRMEFLWVRWLGRDPTHKCGWKADRLDRVGFVPHTDPEAFGFLDPRAVIRAVHLIPAFAHGRTHSLCPPSIARDDDGDWEYFYVNRFVHHIPLQKYSIDILFQVAGLIVTCSCDIWVVGLVTWRTHQARICQPQIIITMVILSIHGRTRSLTRQTQMPLQGMITLQIP